MVYVYAGRIRVTFWDYRLNHSIYFSGDVPKSNFDYWVGFDLFKRLLPLDMLIGQAVLCEDAVLIWHIPSHAPDLSDCFTISLLSRVPFLVDMFRGPFQMADQTGPSNLEGGKFITVLYIRDSGNTCTEREIKIKYSSSDRDQ